jgi:hypothetical protein
MLAVGDTFETIQATWKAINRYVLNNGKSYKVYKSDSKYHILRCKDESCTFSIRAVSNKKDRVSITKIGPYCCCPTVYYKNKNASVLWFLKEHYRATVLDNRNITAKQIQSNEQLQFNNNISYCQALCMVCIYLSR